MSSPENEKRSSPFATLRSDLPASVVVFLVALPLCLGISLASGAPLISGVIAGIVGGIVVGALSGSHVGVAGPAAGLAVIVLTAIESLGSFEIFLVAVVLAGCIQLALGYARAGVIGYYFPSSVITGMLAGIGIVIFLKQLPHAVGYDHDPEGDFSFIQADGETAFSEIAKAVQALSPGPMIIAAISLVTLILWETKRFKQNKVLSLVPGPLVAVVIGVVLSLLFGSQANLSLAPDQLVQIPVLSGFDGLREMVTLPDFSGLMIPEVYKTAIVLAVVASLETLLCVEATDKMDPVKRVTPTNRELKAQGVGNIVAGFLGGIPVTQVIVRSSANIQAGGKSKISAIAHGILLLIAVIVLPRVMNLIPLATLAAILLLVGYKLARPALFKKMFRAGKSQFIPFLVTVGGVVFIDLLMGIGIGLVAATAGLLIENFRLPFHVDDFPETRDNRFRIVLAQQVTFLNKASVLRTLSSLPDGSKVEIDGTGSAYVHPDVIEIIDDFLVSAESRDIQVLVKGLSEAGQGLPGPGTNITLEPNPEQV